MKTRLINAFETAIEHYTNKANRGYEPGLFSAIRHSFSKTPMLATLETELNFCKQDDEALQLIVEHFLSKNATFNNHSFNSYLLDELKKTIKEIDWNCFTPKAIKTYSGAVYRGTSQPPEKIFKDGFKELVDSSLVEHYLKFRNNSTGISTSKDFRCALEYALFTKRSGSKRFLYAINYRGEHGYDLLETGKARGLWFDKFFHPDRHDGLFNIEVNIKGHIDNDDIIGAWEILDGGVLSWIDNPHYQLEKNSASQPSSRPR